MTSSVDLKQNGKRDIRNVGCASWQSVRPQKTTFCSDATATATIPPYKHSRDKNSQRHTSCCVAPQTAPFETSPQLLWSFLFPILFKPKTPQNNHYYWSEWQELIVDARTTANVSKPHNGVYFGRPIRNLWPRSNSGVSAFVIGNRYIAVKTYRTAVHLCLVSAV